MKNKSETPSPAKRTTQKAKAADPTERLRSDAAFRSSITLVCSLARKQACFDKDQVVAAFKTGSFRMVSGVSFAVTKELDAAIHAAATRGQFILGPVLGNEKDLIDDIWKNFTSTLLSDEEITEVEFAKSVIDSVCDGVVIEYDYISPNRLFRIADNVDACYVGPVSIRRTEDVASEIHSARPDEKWKIAVGDEPETLLGGDIVIFQMTPISWSIKIKASKKNLDEEALWLADVATSIIRLSGIELGFMSPTLGDVEAHPFHKVPEQSYSIGVSEKYMHSSGGKRRGCYVIEQSAAKVLEPKHSSGHFDRIFQPAKSTMGERLKRGLGWLSRARRATDRSERFLLFFTALESILSSESSNTGVTDTLARHTAVLWSEDVSVRRKTYATVKALYDKRSLLVHRGLRDVTHRDVNTIQYIAENIHGRVLDEVDFDQGVDKFQASLAEASFGSPWPPSEGD